MATTGQINYTTADINTAIGNALSPPPSVDGQVQNRWVANQNFNVPGKDGYPLLDAVPQDILAGNEIAAGIIALTECQQMTKVNGIIKSGNGVGIIRRSYPKDDAGEITKNSQYGGFKDHLGEQIQADVDAFSAGGVRITDDASNVYVDVDLSIATDGLQFLFLANEAGIIENVSDYTSFVESYTMLADLSANGYAILPQKTDGKNIIMQWGSDATASNHTIPLNIPMPNGLIQVIVSQTSPSDTGAHALASAFTVNDFFLNRTTQAGTARWIAIGY